MYTEMKSYTNCKADEYLEISINDAMVNSEGSLYSQMMHWPILKAQCIHK